MTWIAHTTSLVVHELEEVVDPSTDPLAIPLGTLVGAVKICATVKLNFLLPSKLSM